LGGPVFVFITECIAVYSHTHPTTLAIPIKASKTDQFG
jgi:hypothetical protein